MKSRDEAFALLSEYTKSESLIKHALSVEAAMRWYARHFEQSDNEINKWGITGLLHDFDYEQFPDPTPPDGHPYKGNKILEKLGYPQDMRDAIMGHAQYTGVERKTLMAKTLFAVDELTGLITASVLVRPDRSLHTLTPKSVKKKMKDLRFAAGCNREDIRQGAEELGVDLTQHIQNVINGMREVADQLGLAGVSAAE
ncbi:MAG: HAD family hydrolase [Candidatus Dadabacteria bacterium]|nr:MAG: HAD family hydrolase [Candidatus Dadabacteria bacterium]